MVCLFNSFSIIIHCLKSTKLRLYIYNKSPVYIEYCIFHSVFLQYQWEKHRSFYITFLFFILFSVCFHFELISTIRNNTFFTVWIIERSRLTFRISSAEFVWLGSFIRLSLENYNTPGRVITPLNLCILVASQCL